MTIPGAYGPDWYTCDDPLFTHAPAFRVGV